MRMRGILRRRPSPAMVVACLALLVALGGTSYAASQLPANSVGTKQLKKGAVTAVKVRDNSLTGRDIKESTLSMVPLAADSDATDTLDGYHADELLGVSGYETSVGTAVPISEYQEVVSAVATCPVDKVALGGGASLGNNAFGGGIRLAQSYPVAVGTAAGWRVTVVNNWSESTSLTPYVVCAVAAQSTN